MKKYLITIGLLLTLLVGYLLFNYFVERSQPKNPFVGRDCRYVDYPGTCTITSISTYKTDPDGETIGGQNYDGYEITYSFSLLNEADLEKVDWAWGKDIASGKERPLTYVNGFLLGDKFIEKHSLKEGNTYSCELKISKSGPCSPVVLEFLDLNLADYVDLD